jgi:hypothetical protein
MWTAVWTRGVRVGGGLVEVGLVRQVAAGGGSREDGSDGSAGGGCTMYVCMCASGQRVYGGNCVQVRDSFRFIPAGTVHQRRPSHHLETGPSTLHAARRLPPSDAYFQARLFLCRR